MYDLATTYLTALTCRLALLLMGYWVIPTELVSSKLSTRGVAQLVRPARRGDVIVCNWTSYSDILYLAFKWVPDLALS